MGKDSALFKELVAGSLTVLQWVFGQYKLDLVVSFLFVGGRAQGWESGPDQDALCEIPK